MIKIENNKRSETMTRTVKYYGFVSENVCGLKAWNLERVFSDGSAQLVKTSTDKNYIISECERLNKLLTI